MADQHTELNGRAVGLLAVVCCAFFLDALDVSMLNVAVPAIGAELAMGSSLSWVIAGYVLGFGGLLLLGGRTADLFGRRRVLLTALGVFVAMSALGGVAWNGEVLIATRVLKGVAAAFTAPAALSLLTSSFAEGPVRNRALAFYTATGSAGFTFGLVFGGLLTEWNWRAVFFMPAVVGAVTLIVGLLVVPPDRPAPRRGRLDVGGAVTVTVAMMSIVYALTSGPEHGWSRIGTWGFFVIGACSLGAFVVVERRVAEPLIPLHLLRSWPRVRANLIAPCFVGGWGAAQFLLTLYLQDTRGWSPLETAAAFWPCGILGLFLAPYVARLINRFTLPGVMSVGLALSVGSYLLLQLVGADTAYWTGLFPVFALIGLAFTLVFATVSIAATTGVRAEEQGIAGGVLQTSIQFGTALLLAVTAAVYASRLPPAGGPAQMEAYGAGWMVPLVAAAACLIVALAGVRGARKANA